MENKLKGLLFDLDGVLVNTEINHFQSWKSIAEELNVAFDEKFNESLKGLSRADSLKTILTHNSLELNDEQFSSLLQLKNTYYLESIKNLNEENILPGVMDLIREAKAKKIKLGVGSSSKNARTILKRIGLTKYFDVIVDGNDVVLPKPHPEVFEKGARALQLSPKEIIVFEDAQSGVEAARCGGFRVFGVGNMELMELTPFFLKDLTEFRLTDYA